MTIEEIRANAPKGATHYIDVNEVLIKNRLIGCEPNIFTYHKCVDGLWYVFDAGYWFNDDDEKSDAFFSNPYVI